MGVAFQGCTNGVPLSIRALAGRPLHGPPTFAVHPLVVGPDCTLVDPCELTHGHV